jgi:hypothetical protein
VLFLALSLLFSALPFLSGLLLDKSSLPLAVITAWYALIPPLVLLVLAWLLYRSETSWVAFVGRLWVSLGLWFGLLVLLESLSDLHILVLMLTLPSMLAGGKGYAAGAGFFLIGGVLLWLLGRRLGVGRVARPKRTAFLTATGSLLAIIVIGVPLLIFLTSRPVDSLPTGGPELPSEGEVFAYITDIYNLGIRRPGWPAHQQARDYIATKLDEFGFEQVNVEPFTFDFWRERSWGLTVDPGGEAWQPKTYFVPYSGPTDAGGVTAELVYLDQGSEQDFAGSDVSGKIVLVQVPPTDISWSQMKLFTYMAYDPQDTVGDWQHPYPIGWLPKIESVYELAEEHGAAGIVGILQGYPELGEFGYYAPYDGVFRQIPTLYLLEGEGERLRQQVEQGPVTVNLLLDAQVAKQGAQVWDVYGVLPGEKDDIVMVHTQYDSPWQSGVEEGSGVGVLLGLARYYAQLPASEREHTMVFIFFSSHFVGAQSNLAFIDEHADDLLADLLLDVCIEHIADDYNPPNPPTGMVEPRGNFMTENPVAISLYTGAVADYDANRMLIFPTGTPLSVPTDAGMFAASGYPISSLISGPVWLFDDDDTLERVARDQLEPLSAMYIDFIARLGGVAAPLLRFNLNIWTMVLVAVLLTPLATISAAHWPRREG